MAETIKQLEKAQTASEISPLEARDALLGCFVAIHGETLKRGALILGKELSPEEVESHATAQMKMLMGEKFNNPTKDSLAEVKPKLDQKMNFSKVDADLKNMHDQVCSMILSKVK